MKLIDRFTNKFTDTVFYKKESELEYQIDALKRLLENNPNNSVLLKKLKLCELGLQGEKEIEFELKNANIGMYVLHDVNLQYKDLKAQVDYIAITPAKTYFIECKNLIGNITIDNKGNFIREYSFGRKKIKEGIYSPLSQANRHIEIYKKIWMEKNTGILDKTVRLKHFNEWTVPLVVLANSKSILNVRYAPKDIKKYIIKSDRLVDYLIKDLECTDRDALWNKKDMNDHAFGLMNNYNNMIERDYEKELQEWLLKKSHTKFAQKDDNCNSNNKEKETDSTKKSLNIRNKLVYFRKEKSREKNIPAYYIFNNDELDKILILMPKTKQELIDSKILTDVKIRLHGDEIIKIIND